MFRYEPDPIPGERIFVQSRPLLEQCVRARVRDVPNISFIHRTGVERPVVDDGRVTGVVSRDGFVYEADLVIDASGRNSCTARWLDSLGYQTAPEQRIGCDVQYVSAIVEPDDWDAFDGSLFFVMPSMDGPHGKRLGAVGKLESGRWLLGLVSRHGDLCPTDWDKMLAFGDTLHSPAWSECARRTTPVEPVMTYRMPAAIRHRYDQLDRFPDGLLPIGDSICFFNPTYGQGMSAAAGQCRGLRELLAARAATGAGLAGLAKEFFPIANEWVRGPWAMAAMNDLEYDECQGDLPVDELADLQRFGEINAACLDRPELIDIVIDLVGLRRPLSAVNEVQLV
jgi:2-polyprenyl-6-methoxyphenol hydroxylase-like FAD-dependent oxidoreductase